ncbi:OB-fold putative lipoprotein [Flavihumibacter fluvii]|uniref:OB-fold putative lipoprotein n=1 Tax=Flavihumibacter fluvii TaxID=2838157 RepID=UPI001BDF405B|nr:OB-fold putative lipoprotein [Flavihumibacter fluvii]ULQ51067.1 OB-fold putative lipoprotein [Flavihumibacter fluvii]
MKARNLIVSVAVLMLLIVGIFYAQYNKPSRNIADEQSIPVTAEQLFQQFAENEQAANGLYLNKVVEVSGDVLDIKHTEQGQDVIILKSNDPMFGTSCTLDTRYGKPEKLKPGDKATVKGVCTGYLTDVVLIRSSVIK